VALMILLLAGCASLQKDFDPPGVTLENFRTLPSEQATPRFEITLRVTNPNAQAIEIVGISHSIELMGRELVSGVTNEVPTIEPYGEQVVRIESSLKMFQLIRLLAGFGLSPTDHVDYRLSAKIDFAGFMPTQRIEESGTLNLASGASTRAARPESALLRTSG
jgi:LEA14-like dessication related protein